MFTGSRLIKTLVPGQSIGIILTGPTCRDVPITKHKSDFYTLLVTSLSTLTSSPKKTTWGFIRDPQEHTGTASSNDAALTVNVENYFWQLIHAAGKENEPCAKQVLVIPACFSNPSIFCVRFRESFPIFSK